VAKKYYVVWQGRQTGVFTDWSTCSKHVDKFPGAKFKSYPTREEADAAFAHGRPSASRTRDESKPAKKRSSGQSVKTYTAAEIDAMPVDTKIFTDGACDPNPGQAGSGVAVYRNDEIAELWYGLYDPQGTNNTAELHALNQAFLMVSKEVGKGHSVAIFCDSKYAIQCVTQWAVNWKKNGWKRKVGEIKNLDLIKEMFDRHQTLQNDVQVLHVNGHVGVAGNELADRMSMVAIEKQQPDFVRYSEPFDIDSLLAMRSG
jgi:ribonuclease HI